MNRQRWTGILAIALLILLWIYMLASVPTLDFDESLYRSVSEAMKIKGDPWWLAWDSRPLHHKPPVLYWLIVAASSLIDAGRETVSSFAARLPGALSSLGILIFLYSGIKHVLPGPVSRESGLAPVFAFLCAGFAVLTSAAVIFDPLQTLALMPALLIPTRIFLREEKPDAKTWLVFGASLALATMIKGLNGIVIPSFAFGLHLLLSSRRRGLAAAMRTGVEFLVLAFLPAAILSAAFYFLLDRKIGPEFTSEFFWVQHFGRSRAPMEAHSGSALYHPLVLFLGGGFLTPLVVSLWRNRRPDLIRYGFPLTFAFSFVFFFTLSATKLPHYTWPAWPALALFAGLMHNLPGKSSKTSGLLFTLPVALMGGLLFSLGAAPEILIATLAKTPEVKSLVASMEPFGVGRKLVFLAGSLACFVFVARNRTLGLSPREAAFLSMTSLSSLLTGLAPSIDSILVRPFVQIADDLKATHPSPGDCIRYSGPQSATLSLALGPHLLHNRCEPSDARYLITPEWKAGECLQPGFTGISRHGHLILCRKDPQDLKKGTAHVTNESKI
jgi:4-amino-4-deoxy-L-arabinose transferase-like glycosyltransferase